LKEVPIPELKNDEVLIRVKACGICGSDVHGMDGSTGRRIPPVIMGHEASGVLTEIGSKVNGWKINDRVTFDSTIYCGRCIFCREGKINLCSNRRVLGVSCNEYRQNGAFAEYIAVPEHILYKLPEGISFEYAAMTEALSIAFHAVKRTPIILNDNAVVVGSGMIGLLLIQSLRIAGCGKIIAIDIDDTKLKLAEKLGADFTINSNTTDVKKEIESITNGSYADIAFEVVGISSSVNTAVEVLKKGGFLTLVGNLSVKIDFPLQNIVIKEISVIGSCASSGEYPACLEMIANKKIDVKALISKVAPLDEGEVWFNRLYNKEPNLMKVILIP